jgi:GNAT superfamily N-acetyltransferase
LYQLVSLQETQVKDFETLTFQHLLPRFRRIDQDPRLIAIGAEYYSKPIGLVVAEVNPERRTAEVLSVFVKKDYRNFGVGAALLAEIESRINEEGCETVKLAYYSGKAITPVLEAFLCKRGWSEPVVHTLIYTTDMETMAQAPWFRRFKFPRNMHSFLWSELSEIERERLRSSETIGYPPYLSPFKNEQNIEKLISLGLREGDQVIGWSVVHRVAEDTLLYNSLFVQSQYQHLGCAIILLAASIQLQQEHNIPYSMFAVNMDNPVMRRIVDRWFKPYTIKTTEMYATFKSTSQARCLDAKV